MQKTDSYQSPDRNSCIDYETPSENDEEEASTNRKSSSAAAAGVVGSRKNDSPKSPASTISISSSIDYQTQSDDEEPEPSPIRKQSPLTHKSPPSDRISRHFSSIPSNSSINSLKPPYSSSNRMTKEDRIQFTRLLLRRQDLKNLYALSHSSLKFWLRKADNLAHDNADLQLLKADLKNRLISSIINDFRSPIIRDNRGTGSRPNNRVAPSCEADPVTSPTSVIGNINQGFEENSVQFQPERASLPKSISVRSSSYFKMNAGRNTTAPPFDRITGRHRSDPAGFVPRSMNAGRNTTAPRFNRITSRLRPDATPFVPRWLRVHMPTSFSVVDDQKKKKDPVEMEASVQGMYKTELCNKWRQTGGCRYGHQCQFAHGIGELRPVIRHPRYKTQVCRVVLNGGSCPYGHRCHFRHVLTDQESRAAGVV